MRPHADGTVPAHQPHCLGCGPDNPASMGLRLRIDDDHVRGTVATVLDDALGTVLVILERPAVTANLNVDFRAPAFLEHDLTIEAWSDRVDGRKLHLVGRLLDGDNVIAEARGLFIEVDLNHFRRGGKELPDRWTDWKREGAA